MPELTADEAEIAAILERIRALTATIPAEQHDAHVRAYDAVIIEIYDDQADEWGRAYSSRGDRERFYCDGGC